MSVLFDDDLGGGRPIFSAGNAALFTGRAEALVIGLVTVADGAADADGIGAGATDAAGGGCGGVAGAMVLSAMVSGDCLGASENFPMTMSAGATTIVAATACTVMSRPKY